MDNTLNITAAVFNRAFKDKALREAKKSFAEGDVVEGELDVRIPFRLTKGFSSEIKPTASVLSQAVLAKALLYAGCTAEAIKEALLRAAREALVEGHTIAQELTSEDPRVARMSAQLDEVINQMPKTKRAGSVSVTVLTESGLPEVRSISIRNRAEEVELAA